MRALSIVMIALIAIAILISCGHARRLPVTQPGDALTTAASTANPKWLSDALAELDALERPADANPSLFSALKADLARLLRDKAAGKLVSTISAGYTTAANLRFRQDSAEADVFLEWGYVNRGDYDQSGIVGVSDITPLAQQLTKAWLPNSPVEDWD